MPVSIDPEELLESLSLNDAGLVAVVVQDARNAQVLMQAWMNRKALELTLATGDVTYFSRSRQQLWRKGATSGNTQRLVSVALDCDGDALLIAVEQKGAACHTGERSCFYRQAAWEAGDAKDQGDAGDAG